MRTPARTTVTLAAVLALLASLAMASVTMAAETTLSATLAGVAEGANPGDPDGSGTASITLDPETGEVCWNMTATGIMPVTQSHIHTGAAGVSGGIVVDLDVDGFEGSSEGCTSDVEAATINDILANPAGFYVNLHTPDFPAGAIRGQLAAGVPSTAVGVPAAGVLALAGLVLLIGALGLALAPRALRRG